MTPPPVAASHGLRRAVVSGLAWKGASQVVTQVLRFAIAVALARLLTPHDYGLAGMVLVFMSFVLLFSDFALGHTIVQRRDLDHEQASTAFWTSVAAGITFTAVGVGIAGPVASFFGQPALRAMLIALAFTFLIQAVGTTQSALLVREMAFRSLELRQMAATLLGGVVAICVAVAGYGAWAIVAQQLANAVASTLLVWLVSPWRPRRSFSTAVLRSFAGFTSNVFGTNLLTQLRGTSDNLLVGKFLGPTPLGAYALAYNLVLVPFNRIAVPLAQVLFPALSQVQDDVERIGRYWVRSLRLIGAVAIPSTVGLIVLAPDFVDVVLGRKWHHAVRVVQLLALVGLLQTLQFLTPIVLQAVNRTGTLLRWTGFAYACSLLAFVVGLHWGIVGVATAYVLSSLVVEPLFARAGGRAVGLSLRTMAGSLVGIALASLLMGALLAGGRRWGVDAGVPAAARLVALVAVGGALYLGFARVFAHDLALDLRGLRRGRQSVPRVEPAATP